MGNTRRWGAVGAGAGVGSAACAAGRGGRGRPTRSHVGDSRCASTTRSWFTGTTHLGRSGRGPGTGSCVTSGRCAGSCVGSAATAGGPGSASICRSCCPRLGRTRCSRPGVGRTLRAGPSLGTPTRRGGAASCHLRSGMAAATRGSVRFCRSPRPRVGQPSAGASAAVDSERAFLESAGCSFLGGPESRARAGRSPGCARSRMVTVGRRLAGPAADRGAFMGCSFATFNIAAARPGMGGARRRPRLGGAQDRGAGGSAHTLMGSARRACRAGRGSGSPCFFGGRGRPGTTTVERPASSCRVVGAGRCAR